MQRQSPAKALGHAIALLGSQSALARAAGVAQQVLNRAVQRGGHVSPRIALGIHKATGGKVSADQLRPDLWASPDHVPVNGRGPASPARRRAKHHM